jgi:hypothetical protein
LGRGRTVFVNCVTSDSTLLNLAGGSIVEPVGELVEKGNEFVMAWDFFDETEGGIPSHLICTLSRVLTHLGCSVFPCDDHILRYEGLPKKASHTSVPTPWVHRLRNLILHDRWPVHWRAAVLATTDPDTVTQFALRYWGGEYTAPVLVMSAPTEIQRWSWREVCELATRRIGDRSGRLRELGLTMIAVCGTDADYVRFWVASTARRHFVDYVEKVCDSAGLTLRTAEEAEVLNRFSYLGDPPALA